MKYLFAISVALLMNGMLNLDFGLVALMTVAAVDFGGGFLQRRFAVQAD